MTPTISQKIQTIVDKIARGFDPQKIILFGSYAWGTPSTESDVDLCIVKEDSRDTFSLMREVNRSIAHRDIPVDIVVYRPQQLAQRSEMGDPFVRRIINQGKVLYEKQ